MANLSCLQGCGSGAGTLVCVTGGGCTAAAQATCPEGRQWRRLQCLHCDTEEVLELIHCHLSLFYSPVQLDATEVHSQQMSWESRGMAALGLLASKESFCSRARKISCCHVCVWFVGQEREDAALLLPWPLLCGIPAPALFSPPSCFILPLLLPSCSLLILSFLCLFHLLLSSLGIFSKSFCSSAHNIPSPLPRVQAGSRKVQSGTSSSPPRCFTCSPCCEKNWLAPPDPRQFCSQRALGIKRFSAGRLSRS